MSDLTTSEMAAKVIAALADEINLSMPSQRRSGPVMCEECGNEWVDCTCDETNLTHNLFAFHGLSSGTYKVWKLEDTVFVQDEREQGTQTIIFLPDELTRLAQMWLALQPDGSTHEHVFASTLDPRYEACACGEARQVNNGA